MKCNGLLVLALLLICCLTVSCAWNSGGGERYAKHPRQRVKISGLTSNQVEILATFGDTNPQTRGDQIGRVWSVLGEAIGAGGVTSLIDRVSLEMLIGEPIDAIYSEPLTVSAEYEAGTQSNPSKVLVIIYVNGYVRSYGVGDYLRHSHPGVE
jgi:hypothetical protein